jgi:bacterioferritin
MGSIGREIIGMEVDELLNLLAARIQRRMACLPSQCRLGAKGVKGPMKDAVGAESLQHATEK